MTISSDMGSRHMDFPSPRGVHVPESYYASIDPDDPYRRPSSLRNRYTRGSVHQTPRVRDVNVTWISSPEHITPQTPRAPPSPWLAPPLAPSTPAQRLPSPIPPSPVPTVGEHMSLDDVAFVQDDFVDPYRRPQRPGLIKSIWRGFKKLSGLQPLSFPIPRPVSYGSQPVGVPAPVLSAQSEATQYVNPTPPETSGTRTSGTEERRSTTPRGSPYARPASPYARPLPSPFVQLASPYARPPSPYARPSSPYARPPSPYARPPSPYARPTSPYTRPASARVTPAAAVIPGSLRASPVPVPSIQVPPPITVISPSDPSTPLPHPIRSTRAPSPIPSQRNPSVGAPEPVGSVAEGSQTLHEPVHVDPALAQPIAMPIPILRVDNHEFPQNGAGVQFSPVDSRGSPSSTMARFRRFVASVDGLPWISDAQIADEYIPEKTPRGRLRAKMRQGAEPSWYNPRLEMAERPAHWSEWDMWAKQSTAAFGNDTPMGHAGWAGLGTGGGLGQGQAQWGMGYPHGSMPVQPWHMYPSGYPPPGEVSSEDDDPVLP